MGPTGSAIAIIPQGEGGNKDAVGAGVVIRYGDAPEVGSIASGSNAAPVRIHWEDPRKSEEGWFEITVTGDVEGAPRKIVADPTLIATTPRFLASPNPFQASVSISSLLPPGSPSHGDRDYRCYWRSRGNAELRR